MLFRGRAAAQLAVAKGQEKSFNEGIEPTGFKTGCEGGASFSQKSRSKL
ncbi:MAG: hypothetical protein FWD08_03860 [Alphaproteobacteria bacterium]|nr:hypothetical protein [Alphaproteobacteria bacterium]